MKFSHLDWAALIFAFLFVQGVYIREHVRRSPCCDAAGYLQLGQQIQDHGMFSRAAFSDLRTYGYPLFLAVVRSLFAPQRAAIMIIAAVGLIAMRLWRWFNPPQS